MHSINIDLDSKRVWPTTLAAQGRPVFFPAISTEGVRKPDTLPVTEDSQLLTTCREKMGLTQTEMAQRLDLPVSTYHAYEYARVRKVPKGILERAQSLVGSTSEVATQLSRYPGLSMVEISGIWAKRINVDPGNVTEFALRLGVNKSTVSRWRAGGKRLSMRNILMYEQIVEKIEAKMQQTELPAKECLPV